MPPARRSTAQRVGTALEGHYKADSLTLTVQDGPVRPKMMILPRSARGGARSVACDRELAL